MGSSTNVEVNGQFNVTATTQANLKTVNVDSVTDMDLFPFNRINQWLYRRVNLNLAINDVISINARISGSKSVIAFDDMQVIRQACEQPGWCDFENGKFLDN